MISIRFSHKYVKMPQDFEISTLTSVENVNLEYLDPAFLERDTAIVGGGHYPLPKKGRYMILWLESPSGAVWQTIRPWNPGKEKYYESHIGELVRCLISA